MTEADKALASIGYAQRAIELVKARIEARRIADRKREIARVVGGMSEEARELVGMSEEAAIRMYEQHIYAVENDLPFDEFGDPKPFPPIHEIKFRLRFG